MNPSEIKFKLEPLAKHHQIDSFQSENQQLDRYLKHTASQDCKRNIAVPYVVINLENTQTIGYYSLSMNSIDLGELPDAIAKKLPKYPLIGVTLIGRLAVDKNYQGLGWGKLLLMDALHKSLTASKQVASFAVVVEAIDEAAVKFYQRFDFQTFPDQPFKLLRTMANIAQTFR